MLMYFMLMYFTRAGSVNGAKTSPIVGILEITTEIGCGMDQSLKYFILFQLGSKPIVFHFEFHEIKFRGK